MQATLSGQFRVKRYGQDVPVTGGDGMTVDLGQDVDFLAVRVDPWGTDEDPPQRADAGQLDLGFERTGLTAEGVAPGVDVEHAEVVAVEHDHPGAGAERRGARDEQLT